MPEASGKGRKRTHKIRPTQFSLAGILLLTIVVAISMAAVRTAVVQKDLWGDEYVLLALWCGLGGLMTGPVVGTTIGFRQRQPVRGVLVETVVGWIAAGLAVVLLITPGSLPVVGCGLFLLIGFGLAVRFLSKKRLASDRGDPEASQSAASGHTDQYG